MSRPISVSRTPGIGFMPKLFTTWTCEWPPPTARDPSGGAPIASVSLYPIPVFHSLRSAGEFAIN